MTTRDNLNNTKLFTSCKIINSQGEYRPKQQKQQSRLTALVQHYPGEPVPERYNQSGFYWSKR